MESQLLDYGVLGVFLTVLLGFSAVVFKFVLNYMNKTIKENTEALKAAQNENKSLEQIFRDHLIKNEAESHSIISEFTKVLNRLIILIEDKQKEHNLQQRDFNNSMLNEVRNLNKSIKDSI